MGLLIAFVVEHSTGESCCLFRGIIHANGEVLAEYLAENYCPTIEEEHQEGCPAHLAQHYPGMLGAVVHRLIYLLVTI